jgi:NADP-dependent 3-hydroxy acid dehydrogenase YdfG
VRVSPIGGISALAGISIYHASEWALEGISQPLAQEVNGFAIKSRRSSPAGWRLGWLIREARSTLGAYAPVPEV